MVLKWKGQRLEFDILVMFVIVGENKVNKVLKKRKKERMCREVRPYAERVETKRQKDK